MQAAKAPGAGQGQGFAARTSRDFSASVTNTFVTRPRRTVQLQRLLLRSASPDPPMRGRGSVERGWENLERLSMVRCELAKPSWQAAALIWRCCPACAVEWRIVDPAMLECWNACSGSPSTFTSRQRARSMTSSRNDGLARGARGDRWRGHVLGIVRRPSPPRSMSPGESPFANRRPMLSMRAVNVTDDRAFAPDHKGLADRVGRR